MENEKKIDFLERAEIFFKKNKKNFIIFFILISLFVFGLSYFNFYKKSNLFDGAKDSIIIEQFFKYNMEFFNFKTLCESIISVDFF